jgi:hypothetical protein
VSTGELIAVILCVLGTLVLLGLPLTALVIRAAVRIFNRFAGSPKIPALVPLPSLTKGMLIALIASVVNVAVYVTATFATGALSTYGQPNPQMSFTAWLISSPISLLVLAALLTTLLPTTFSRALLITFCYVALAVVFIIATTIAIALIAVILAIALGLN